MTLFFAPEGRLRLTQDDRSWLEVVPRWAAPRSSPGRWLSLVDGKGHEILMLETVDSAGPENAAILREELGRRYLHAVVREVISASTEFGTTYWTVETDRGRREFVTRSLQENAQWVTPDFLLLIDVEGNHYHIESVEGLDERSRGLVNRTV